MGDRLTKWLDGVLIVWSKGWALLIGWDCHMLSEYWLSMFESICLSIPHFSGNGVRGDTWGCCAPGRCWWCLMWWGWLRSVWTDHIQIIHLFSEAHIRLDSRAPGHSFGSSHIYSICVHNHFAISYIICVVVWICEFVTFWFMQFIMLCDWLCDSMLCHLIDCVIEFWCGCMILGVVIRLLIDRMN